MVFNITLKTQIQSIKKIYQFFNKKEEKKENVFKINLKMYEFKNIVVL